MQVVRNHPDIFSSEASTPRHPAWSGLPVVFDEVFTGLYRLGRFSAASFLDVHPDISVHAKLLTGGLLPLAVTLASRSIFESFLGDSKTEALLHGHSYTAHAVGCSVAVSSLETMINMEEKGAWNGFRADWANTALPPNTSSGENEDKSMSLANAWSMWSQNTVETISNLERVEGVFALGSVLAITFVDANGSGYNSSVTEGVQQKLLNHGAVSEAGIHARILGNVLYLMTSMTSTQETTAYVERRLLQILQERS